MRMFKYSSYENVQDKKRKMAKHCIYCKAAIDEQSVIDFCERCGIGVWGEKMFRAILESMKNARDAGDLYQGSVTSQEITKR